MKHEQPVVLSVIHSGVYVLVYAEKCEVWPSQLCPYIGGLQEKTTQV